MSTPFAIASITAALRNLIESAVRAQDLNATVSTQPPDKANDDQNSGEGANRLNLFLYQTEINEVLRNQDWPHQTKAYETGYPPLALRLYYLLTAYGKKQDDLEAHKLLGTAMGVLHDHPVLSLELLENAQPQADVQHQVERVHVTLQPLSAEDMSKLWTTFQTQYRISAAYQVSSVLIDSTRQGKAALPVLKRGSNDEGVQAQADMAPPYPTLSGIKLPPERLPKSRLNAKLPIDPILELGDAFTLIGHHLAGNNVQVWCRHHLTTDWSSPLILTPQANTSTEDALELSLPALPGPQNDPNAANYWLAGSYILKVVFLDAHQTVERETNIRWFAIAPKISPQVVDHDATHWRVICACLPGVRLPHQAVSLLLGDKQFSFKEVGINPQGASPYQLQFKVPKAQVQSNQPYFVRLRVDGVESLLIQDYSSDPPKFDDTQRVTIP